MNDITPDPGIVKVSDAHRALSMPDLARLGAAILERYSHLAPIAVIRCSTLRWFGPRIEFHPEDAYSREGVRDVALWAAHFEVPLILGTQQDPRVHTLIHVPDPTGGSELLPVAISTHIYSTAPKHLRLFAGVTRVASKKSAQIPAGPFLTAWEELCTRADAGTHSDTETELLGDFHSAARRPRPVQ